MREILALANYLAGTPVAGYALDLARSQLRASHVTIAGRDSLGATWSIFRELGGIVAPTNTSRPYFRIAEVDPTLRRADCTDRRSLVALDWLLARRRDDTFHDWQVVLLDSTIGPMVVDGNKRAAAIYETGGPDVLLPALLLGGPAGERVAAPA